jgi:hypothetical protein
LIAVTFALVGVVGPYGAGASATQSFTPEQIIAGKRLDLLRDEAYYHPVRPDPLEGEVYVRLQKWDLVFTGPLPQHAGNINDIIPGRYDHTLAYVGKDREGYAYFVEINVNSLYDLEGVRMFSPGTDFGDQRHPSGARFWSDYEIEYRWARTFRDDIRSTLRAEDASLTARVTADLEARLPYQMPAKLGPNPMTSKEILLVDDGMEGGANCSDYWTTLFEEQANICFYGVRFSAEDFIEYVLTDPAGQRAYIPDEVNPLRIRLTGRQLLGLGFSVVEDAPHAFRCGGPPESGLVLAELIMDSPLLAAPPIAVPPADPRYLINTIEYHHPELDRYVRTNPTEADLIDSGSAGPGWIRTGAGFNAWSRPRGGATAVNRFFSPSASAHFLTNAHEERDALIALNPANNLDNDTWVLEGIAFYMHAADDGKCPDDTIAVHRVFKSPAIGGPAHRYLTDIPAIHAMIQRGWSYEGVAMCAPR